MSFATSYQFNGDAADANSKLAAVSNERNPPRRRYSEILKSEGCMDYLRDRSGSVRGSRSQSGGSQGRPDGSMC